MKQTFASLLMLLFLQPAMAQRKINKTQDPLQIITVNVGGGNFDLGSDDEAADRRPAHTVKLKSFNIGAYEVTQAQWQAVMGNNPSLYDCAECPVTNVSWDDVQKFIEKLNSSATGGKHYRLPTEAEWEYAARGGNTEQLTTKRDIVARGGVNELLISNPNERVPEKDKTGDKYSGKKNAPQTVAWFDRNSESHIHPIGRKKPNDLAIYDMSGNVEEWCSDFYATSYGSNNTVENPQGPDGGKSHVVRGGSWASDKDEISATRRAAYVPGTKTNSLGFRVVEDSK